MADAKTLKPEGYRPRIIEARLDALMRAFGCVEIHGPKWCGKTWTARTRAASITKLDDPSQRQAAEMDPAIALIGEQPHLVDEWQEVPAVWDAARRFVDDSNNKRGLLLLTGSTALKNVDKEKVHHSGAGRIARLRMYPMTLCESGESQAAVSLGGLLKGEALAPARCQTGLTDVIRWCIRGGWPANLDLDDEIAAETAGQYIQAVLDVNVVNEGRSPEIALSLMRALAMNESQAVTYKTLARDTSYGEDGIHHETITAYLDFFDRLKLTEKVTVGSRPCVQKLACA